MSGTPVPDPLPELMICRARRIWRCATFAPVSLKSSSRSHAERRLPQGVTGYRPAAGEGERFQCL
jgi:hypothetical protein